jgi:hypothetical protein
MFRREVAEPPLWRYTQSARAEYGDTYGNRPLIARDTPIRGGVFYTTAGGEAIVVDPNKYPAKYREWYMAAQNSASENGIVKKDRILRAVFNTVAIRMRYSEPGVEALLTKIATDNGMPAFQDGIKVELGDFMNRGVGICRHQALAAGALLEMFQDDGHIGGAISIDRNEFAEPGDTELEGHAWVRYTTSDGLPYVMDIAHGYLGALDDSVTQVNWEYRRPEELAAAQEQPLLRRIINRVLS